MNDIIMIKNNSGMYRLPGLRGMHGGQPVAGPGNIFIPGPGDREAYPGHRRL